MKTSKGEQYIKSHRYLVKTFKCKKQDSESSEQQRHGSGSRDAHVECPAQLGTWEAPGLSRGLPVTAVHAAGTLFLLPAAQPQGSRQHPGPDSGLFNTH